MEIKQPPEHGVEMMVDIETLGTKPFSVILSIGACRFEAGNLYPMPTFYQPIDIQSCVDVGLKIDPETLKWWLKQSPAAQAVIHDPQAIKLPLALDAFTDYIGDRPDRLWANPARFDMGIIEGAYIACGKVVPWKHWHERDYRTLKNLPGVPAMAKRTGIYHNALDDAVTQAHHLNAILVSLNAAKSV